MEADLRTRLLAESAVTTIVGNRVSWASRPQGTGLPAVTLLKVSPGRGYNHAGADDLQKPRVQIDCWGRTHLEATQLSDAVIATIEPKATVGTSAFSNSLLDADRDADPESLDGGVTAYRRSLDFMVWWTPAS